MWSRANRSWARLDQKHLVRGGDPHVTMVTGEGEFNEMEYIVPKEEEEEAKPEREEENNTFIFEYCNPEDEGQSYQFEMTLDKSLSSDESVTEPLMVRQPITEPQCATSPPDQKSQEMKQEEDVVTSHGSKSFPLPGNEPGISFLRSRHRPLLRTPHSTPGGVFNTVVAKKPSVRRAARRGRSPPPGDENVSQQPSTKQPITEPECLTPRPKRKCQSRKLETEEDEPARPILRPSNNPLLCTLCPYPGKLFKMVRSRLTHVWWAHGSNSSALWLCHLCNKRFRRKTQMSTHARSHAKRSAALTCPLCKEEEGQGGFTGTKWTLGRHMQRKHSGVVPRCNICNKGFLKVSAYVNDLFKHTGVTPFYCPICKIYMFTELGLKKHKLRHQERK